MARSYETYELTADDFDVFLKRRRGFVEINNPDWKPPGTVSQEDPERDESSVSGQAKEEPPPQDQEKGITDCTSHASSEEKQGKKKPLSSLRKVSARERVVREVRAMLLQQRVGKEEGSNLTKVTEDPVDGTNGEKKSSGEEDSARKSQTEVVVDAPKPRGGEQQREVQVNVGTKRRAMEGEVEEPKPREKGSEREKEVTKTMTAVPKQEALASKCDGTPKKETALAVGGRDKNVLSKPVKSREQRLRELLWTRIGNYQVYISDDLSLFDDDPADSISTYSPEIESYIANRSGNSLYNYLKAYKQSKEGGPNGSIPAVVSYEVVLHCMTRDTTETRKLEMWTLPNIGNDIKEKIEEDFQIPKLLQGDLTFMGKYVDESASLSTIGLKSGAKLEMTYLCEGELERVYVVLKWFELMVEFGKGHYLSMFSGIPMEYNRILYQGINECIPCSLAFELLIPACDQVKHTNLIYFLQNNGLELLLQVYEKIMMVSWRNLHFTFKMIEGDLVAILATLCSTPESKKAVIKADGHGFVLQSFLRVRVRRSPRLMDTSDSFGSPDQNYFILKQLLTTAVCFFFNFRSCNEVHMDVCSQRNGESKVVDQFITIIHCFSFPMMHVHDSMCVLLTCMHSLDIHKFVCTSAILEDIVDCVKARRDHGRCSNVELKLLHYYSLVTLAQMMMSCYSYMSIYVMKKVLDFMLDFLDNTQPVEVYLLEAEHRYTSSSTLFFPYMKILLSPSTSVDPSYPKEKQEMQVRVRNCCLETMLFVMQVMCNRGPHVSIRDLQDENLLSYIFCLPSNLPRKLQSRARNLCTLLRKDSEKPVPLPKLSVIARAKLAAIHVGLKKVVSRTADQIGMELSPSLVATYKKCKLTLQANNRSVLRYMSR